MTTPTRRGRRAIDQDDPCVDVHLRMPSKQYEATLEQARRERTTVPEIIRRVLRASSRARER